MIATNVEPISFLSGCNPYHLTSLTRESVFICESDDFGVGCLAVVIAHNLVALMGIERASAVYPRSLFSVVLPLNLPGLLFPNIGVK